MNVFLRLDYLGTGTPSLFSVLATPVDAGRVSVRVTTGMFSRAINVPADELLRLGELFANAAAQALGQKAQG